MTAQKKKSKSKKKSKQVRTIDHSTGRVIRIIVGCLFGVLAIFTLAALISYLFTWSKDLSLASDPELFDNSVAAENSGGKIGFLWAQFLVSKLFGLGAFVIPFFLGAVAVLCFRIRKVNILKLSIVTIFGAIIFSVFFSYIFSFTSMDSLFGNGAGGSYGYFANEWLCRMLGKLGAGCVIALAILIWLSLFTPKVAFWFDSLIFNAAHWERKRKEPVVEAESDDPEEPEDDDETLETEEVEGVSEPEEVVVPKAKIPASQSTTADDVELIIEKDDNDFFPDLPEDEKARLFDPRLDLPNYQQPPLSLLDDYRDKWYEVSRDELEKNKSKIVNALANYKIKVESIVAKMGPTVTLYKIHIADGVRIVQVKRLEEDIAMSLAAKGVRVITLTDAIGIEVANEKPSIVALKSILNSPKFKEATMELPMALGITVTNEPFFLDLEKMPHLLIAGATGMGKSVGLNAIIASLIYCKHPSEMKFVLVDPKKVELSLYNKLEKHFLAMLPDGDEAIITDNTKVIHTLNSLCTEMDSRYDLLKMADVRKIKEYNEKFLSRKLNPAKGHMFLPYIVVIIDEFADLLMTSGREIEEPIARLAQKARAVGIHLVIATQRPTTDIITGTIKANFNSRIAFKVNAMVDSKTILDQTGANRLIGRGDMLVSYPGAELTRVQCALIDTDEIKRITKFVSDQQGYPHAFYLPEYVDKDDDESAIGAVDLHKRDKLFEEAAKIVVQYQQGSTSLIQRKLNLGYNRAGRIIDQLEAAGIVGPYGGSKARSVLVTDFDSLDRILESLDHI
ncbi:MAG: DNA translocase FtsK 4TM domain-containing protein [Bacteroidales bacterium]|nr:DNA translocase FtsK 4TM domain-containing protein [Bacteroidales bacterium]